LDPLSLPSALPSFPAAAVAVALAIALLPAAQDLPTLVAAAAVTIVPALLLVAAFLPAAVSEPGARGREAAGLRSASARRIAFEAMIVGLAVVGVVLLRGRGIRVSDTEGTAGGADPFVAAVPALAGLAAGLVVVRVFPLPMRLLAALAGLRRDLIPVLAMRRVTRGSGSAPVLLVLLGAATVGVFSAATLAHLERSSQLVAWHETGAPYRLDAAGRSLPDDFDPASLPGVETVAGGFRGTVPFGERGASAELLALDVADYLAVVAGTPVAADLPVDLQGGPGTSGEPLPAIVSTALAHGRDGVAAGETFELSIGGRRRTFRAIEMRETFPSLPPGSAFVVVSRTQLEAVATDLDLSTTSAWLRAPDDAAPAIGAAVDERVPGAQVTNRARLTSDLRTAPVAAAVTAGVGVAAAVAAVYAAVAVALALALAGSARAVEVAHLRTLGLSRRQSLALVIVEHRPTVVTASAVGVALGLGLFVLLRPGLGIDALVGSGLAIPVAIEAGQIGLVLAAIIMVAAVGIVLATALQRRGAPISAIRRGFE
jgi:putative ABC transport system permease protein